jgi:LCP family protein required for cell wall assembly
MAQSQTRRPTYASRSAAVGGGSSPGPVYGGRDSYPHGSGPHGSGPHDEFAIDFERTGGGGTGAGRTAGRAVPGSGRSGGGNGGTGGTGGNARRPGGPPPRRKTRDPLWARLLVMFGALLMLLSGGAIVGGKVLLYQATSGVEKAPLLGGAGAPQGAKALKGPLNILMVGIDERPQGNDLVRSDSILILHIPEDRAGAYVVSIPRDSYVEIPAYSKSNFRGSREKVNSAFAHGWANGGGREGGFELLALTLQRLTGLRFNAGAIIDFHGFVGVVDALGGVDMCVDTKRPVVSKHLGFDNKGKFLHPNDGGKPAVYQPGECRTFTGAYALDYVRQRESLEDGDYGRQRHQQQFFKALAKKAKDSGIGGNPAKMLDIIKAGGKTLTVDLRGASIENWLFTVKGLADSDVVLLKANGGQFNSITCGGGESCEQLNEKTLEMFQAMKADTVSEFVLANPDFINAGA